MARTSVVARSVLGAAALGWCAALATGVGACRKDEPPPPLPPTATPTAAPTPNSIVIEAEDASLPPAPSASVTRGVPRPPSFSKCCAALLQNASLAPEPNRTYLNAAANLCSSMVLAGKSGPSIISAVQGLLRGAGMPAACAS